MPDADAVAAAVARNMRDLRAARGWSLDQLAARSGGSKGMLVHLEQGRTNPSLGTLCKLAETFGLTLASLVELHEAPVVRVVRPNETVELLASDKGSSGRLLVGSDEREHVEMWHWALAPGDSSRSEAHADATRQLLHVGAGPLTRGRRPPDAGGGGRRAPRLGRRCGAVPRRSPPRLPQRRRAAAPAGDGGAAARRRPRRVDRAAPRGLDVSAWSCWASTFRIPPGPSSIACSPRLARPSCPTTTSGRGWAP